MSFPPIELYTYFSLCFACFDVVPYSRVVMIMMLQVCDASHIPTLAKMLTLGFLLAESGYLSTLALESSPPFLGLLLFPIYGDHDSASVRFSSYCSS
jgi:hypothetical protein